MLDVPRPTLYRYLKEYPVPYERRSGRISIPEKSLGRIRRVRELHDEGLGTEAVRRRLRDEAPDSSDGRLAERLDRISGALEELREAHGPSPGAVESVSSGDMRALLARQSLLISAVLDMSEMLEELLAAAGRPRRTILGSVRAQLPSPDDTARAIPYRRVIDAAPAHQSVRFGTLARRRRIAALTLLTLVILTGLAALVWVYLANGGA